MTLRLSLLLISVCCAVTVFGQPSASIPDSTRRAIDSILHTQEGDFAVAFRDLSSGAALFIRAEEDFHAASTMKTPVLIEIYRQAAAGRFSLSDSLVLRNQFTSIADSSQYSLSPDDDSEFDLYKHIGEKRSIHDLVYLMITVSSNFATNLLIEKAGPKNIALTLHELGADDIHVLRGVEDNKAYQKGLNNTVTARGLLVLFTKLAKGEVVSPDASQSMIRVLLDQQFNEIIPARLPAGVKVAHKTGWIKGINHDSGIVFLPDGRKYVLVLLSKNTKDDEAAKRAMAAVSEVLYHLVVNK